MPATVTVKTAKLTALARRVTDPTARAVLHKKIGAIYRSFAKERYSRLSRGGGEWKSLSQRTKNARRGGKKKGATFAILIDTGLLFNVLNPVLAPGAIQETRGSAVRLGFGGPSAYPDGKATIADIASFHQFGAGKLPKREIIVEPDRVTLELMTRKVNEWLAIQ